ncbi:MAG TPA: hypothetical protein VFY47_11915, partial [Thermoleophilaceae bacterium]|nr:hypothetical protein [Thermoleophilaceae bacterium]
SITLAGFGATKRSIWARIEQRAKMTSKRAFLLLAALLSLLLTVAPARGEDSGGVTGPTFTQEPGGGVVAPVAPVEPVVVAPVEADAAQETTPTTPGGEEQPPDGQTDTDEGTTTEDGGGTVPGTGNEGDTGAGAESGGGLPTTGLKLAALSMIGLGLLMAGLALRPTSSWPPPRDSLSRSTPLR